MKNKPGSKIDFPFNRMELLRIWPHLARQFQSASSETSPHQFHRVDFGADSRALVSDRKRFSEIREWRKAIDKEGTVVGDSPALFTVFERLHHANTLEDEPAIVLLGETGVGKTMLAKLIHRASRRAGRLYREVNAAGTGGDANIQRGEWIGYGKDHGISGIDRKGKPGHLMALDGGTLFVDEFALLSKLLQGIFLSVLEKRSLQKIGGEMVTPDVRCIFASNVNLAAAVANREMRGDLLARIPEKIAIPSLFERRGDILQLARHFAGSGNLFSIRCKLLLLKFRWPENVRQLSSVVKSATYKKTINNASCIDIEHLELPTHVVRSGVSPSDDDARRELWVLADTIAREEGYEAGAGRQRRAGEILSVGKPQACKMYDAYGLSKLHST